MLHPFPSCGRAGYQLNQYSISLIPKLVLEPDEHSMKYLTAVLRTYYNVCCDFFTLVQPARTWEGTTFSQGYCRGSEIDRLDDVSNPMTLVPRLVSQTQPTVDTYVSGQQKSSDSVQLVKLESLFQKAWNRSTQNLPSQRKNMLEFCLHTWEKKIVSKHIC